MTGDGPAHDVLLFDSDDDLLATAVPFLTAGLAAGDLVLVQGPPHEAEALRDAVDDDRLRVHAQGYGSPMAALAGFQQLCREHNAAGRGVRVVGAPPVVAAPRAADAGDRLHGLDGEWLRYEALVHRALAPYRISSLCPYDTRTLPAGAADLLAAAHDPGTAEALLRDLAPRAVPDRLESTPPVVDLAGCRSAAAVRGTLGAALQAGGLPRPRRDEFLAAVAEIVDNALRHGEPPVDVRLHAGGGRWLCAVSDRGPGPADPYLGYDPPPPPDVPGAGLRLARLLCDRLDLVPRPGGGTTVRLVVDAAG